MMEAIYREYLTSRRNGDNEARLRVKADIAKAVCEGKAEWYLDRLEHHVPVYDMPYGEIAALVSDVKVEPTLGRREPSLAESVLATRDLEKDYQEVAGFLRGRVKTIIKVGSTSWAENFDVRRNSGDPSDLDLEVLIDTIEPGRFVEFPEMRSALEAFGVYHYGNEADYLSFGWKKEDRPISVHFMPTRVFEENCHFDFASAKKETRRREFRVKAKSKPPRYEQRDAWGEVHTFRGQPRLVPGGQITETPLLMVGTRGQMVMGLVMDKYFAFPHVEGDVQHFNDNVRVFKKSVAERLGGGGGRFSGFPSRRQRMPYWLLDQLDEEQRRLYYG
jgi:hypothetical protein